MSKTRANGSVPAFGNFLAFLRLQGFSVGLDHYLRLHQLFERIGSNHSTDELKTLLCPLFATTEKQQERFYSAFDSYAEQVRVSPRPAPPPPTDEKACPPDTGKRSGLRWRYPAIVGSVLMVVVIGIAVGFIPIPPFLRRISQPPVVTTTPDTTPFEVPEGTVPDPPPLIPQGPPTRFYLFVISALLGMFLLWELYRFIRRKLFLRRQAARKPPSVWPISIESPAVKLYDSEEFYRAARLMRRRQVAEYHRLNVNATIAATIAAGGYPTFRYKPDSKAPEYLVLIDRASFQDHQAQLFNELMRAFEHEGLFVIRYFYEGDPRVCCDEKGENAIHLTELQNHYSGHRLLIFGNGDKLLDPIGGRLAAWTSVFLDWQERAVLTPEGRWGLREISLASQFVVLPASLEGLLTLVDQFDTMITIDPRIWLHKALRELPAELDHNASLEELRKYLGEPAFQWLCACAVYPDLQWNLTLYLGSLSCMDPGTIQEKNLLRLIRLPWFRSGSLPDTMRWPLINQLGDSREREVRSAIIGLLEKSPPPEGTFASDKYELELAVQQWRYHQDAESLDQLRRVTSKMTPQQILKDQTLVRYLEQISNPALDLLLPRRLRKFFFRSGIPWFGLKTGVRFLTTLFAIIIAAGLIKTQTVPVPQFLQDPVVSPSATPTPIPAATVNPNPAPTPTDSSATTASPGFTGSPAPGSTRQASPSSSRSPGVGSGRQSSPSATDLGAALDNIPAVLLERPRAAPDNSVVTESLQSKSETRRYLRKFLSNTCPIESIRVLESTDRSIVGVTVTVRLRNGQYVELPGSKWPTVLVDSCADIAKSIGVSSNPTPTPTPTAPTPTPTPTAPVVVPESNAPNSIAPLTEDVSVPNFIGLKEAEMRRRLDRSSLKLGRITYVEPPGKLDIDSPVVRAQNPRPGTLVVKGAFVDFEIYRFGVIDDALVAVPGVVGQSVSKAVKILQKAGLTYEVEKARPDTIISFSDSSVIFKQARFEYQSVPRGPVVVRQDPPAGTKVKKGTLVRLWVR